MGLSVAAPVYPVFANVVGVGAAFTGKGTSSQNSNFSFQRPSASDTTGRSNHFGDNLSRFARQQHFNPEKVTTPNGAWPHSGQAIKAEDYIWETSRTSKTLVPLDENGEPVTYDALATRSHDFVIGAQGADCPTIFLCCPTAGVIGIAHAGWKPVVREVVLNIVTALVELGAAVDQIVAHVSPGAGDRYNVFQWDQCMEPSVRDVFVQAGRTELLHDSTIRHVMTAKDLARLSSALGRKVNEGVAFRLSYLIERDLLKCGLRPENISRSDESCIVDRYPGMEQAFKYHSYRRERPQHGLGMSVLFLNDNE